MTRLLLIVLIICLDAGLAVYSSAEDNTTNIVSGVVTNAGSTYIVGNTGSFNYLLVRNGGRLTDNTGMVGSAASANNNSALITDTNSGWFNTGNFYVGLTGSVNQVTISNGGLVSANNGYVGYDPNSAGNIVLVTSTGSRWTVTNQLVIGYGGIGNQLRIANGGQVYSFLDSFVGGFDALASNSAALVTGIGSAWTNEGDLYVGYYNSANQLIITNGGRVTSQYGYIGAFGSSSNTVAVSGPDSTWNMIGGDLKQDAPNNQLVIAAGGTVNSLGANLGYNEAADGNQALLTGGGTSWTVDGDLYLGNQGSSNLLTIQNGAQLRVVSSYSSYIGYNAVASGNTAIVAGPDSQWNSDSDLFIGNDGSGNHLIITNGSLVSSDSGFVAYNAGSSNNHVIVTGPGSQWVNGTSLDVGFHGSDNSLIVDNGATVSCIFGRVGAFGHRNVAIISGTSSQWLDEGNFFVGQNGMDNRLQIENGGMVSSLNGYVGYRGGRASALVTGDGSLWQNAGSLTVGYEASNNQISVLDGATVQANNVIMGASATSTNNIFKVIGANLIVTNDLGTAAIDVRRGALHVSNATVQADLLLLSSNAVLTGVGTVAATVVTNNGVIAPCSSVGHLTFAGALTLQNSSALNFELAGYNPGATCDFLTVSNAASLGGVLSVTLTNDFEQTVTNGAVFTLMTAASISGSFANVASGSRLLTTDGFADFIVTTSDTAVTLSQTRLIDTDGDGLPDWWMLRHFGHPTGQAGDKSLATDDADGDGVPNGNEYLAGTNPRNASSYLHITAVERRTNDLLVTWTVVGGRKYML